MADETQKTVTGTKGANVFQRLSAALLFSLVKIRFILGLLVVALIEGLAAAIWPRFLGVGVVTVGVAVGLTLANCSLLISEIGMRAGQIHSQLISLHDEELKKLAAQRRAAPTEAQPGRPN